MRSVRNIVIHNFLSENMRRDETEKKNTYRKRIINMKEKTKIIAYQLCKLSNVNAGDFDAFFNKGDNNKLFLKNVEQ